MNTTRGTQTLHPIQFVKFWRALLATLLSALLFATACSNDDAKDEGTNDVSTDSSDTNSDSTLGSATAAEADDEAGDDTADVSDEAEDKLKSESSAPTSGLFADDEPADPEIKAEQLDGKHDNFFEEYGVRNFVDTAHDALSTFALDVDTGSYTITRRWLDEGIKPDPASVRVEEFVNAFEYDYSTPRNGLDIHIDGGPSPFDESNIIIRVGVQAAVIDDRDRANAALTFVVDTSGSMDRADRLGLVKQALTEMISELDDDDTVAIVTYGDISAIVLEPTLVRDDDEIYDAIDDLRPGGSTNLEAGLRTGYELAEQAYAEGGINRVILASDGVANVGTTDPDALSREITDRAINGIQLVTVGFGMGNYNDTIMEQLADEGDGFYAYVDTLNEAKRLFMVELIDNLTPVAMDARIQVELDEDLVDSYRLIGFENRGVLDSDFRSDDVDAGELNSGHTVTAIYELELDSSVDLENDRHDLGTVSLRWQDPETREWIEIDEGIDLLDVALRWMDTTPHFRLSTTVAAWADVLRGSPFAEQVSLRALAEEAELIDDELRTAQTEELVRLTWLSHDLS
ncbi:MAG: von Willebrand factor type A domain-containing protein [Acidimicrobiales bacterium]|nr:von Willebrand factor type A domain-containing protein [Acidimicrobiales bacterium]MDG2217936.1 von Willebrand factor type A domain-containing protein [Acidimicrobiales bacterium]